MQWSNKEEEEYKKKLLFFFCLFFLNQTVLVKTDIEILNMNIMFNFLSVTMLSQHLSW